MSLLSGISDFFGLDIGTTALRVVQLRGSGQVKSLVRYAMAPLDPKLALSDAKADQQKLAILIRDLVAQSGISTRNVAVGLPSQKVFTTITDVDSLSGEELAKSIRYQADSLIPTPIADSKIDFSLIGDSPKDHTKVEIILTSITNAFVEERLDLLESIGLNVIAFEPESIALTRSMVAPTTQTPTLVLDIGSMTTDLIITMGNAPRLIRSINFGTDAIIRAAEQNLNIDQKQAEQFVFKFGMTQQKLEGQIYNAIINTIEVLVAEIDKSIKFFEARYQSVKLEHMIVTGGASALPEFPLYLANKFAKNIEIGNAWRNVSFPADKQNELLSVSNHFGVAAGLAERIE